MKTVQPGFLAMGAGSGNEGGGWEQAKGSGRDALTRRRM